MGKKTFFCWKKVEACPGELGHCDNEEGEGLFRGGGASLPVLQILVPFSFFHDGNKMDLPIKPKRWRGGGGNVGWEFDECWKHP